MTLSSWKMKYDGAEDAYHSRSDVSVVYSPVFLRA